MCSVSPVIQAESEDALASDLVTASTDALVAL